MGCGGCSSNGGNVTEIQDRPIKKGEGVTMTTDAAEYLSNMMKKQKKTGYGLKIEVVPGGCAGYKYYMALMEKPMEDDMTVETSGMKLFLNPESLELMAGSEIGYTEGLEASGLKINNPNATRACGCGKSFG